MDRTTATYSLSLSSSLPPLSSSPSPTAKPDPIGAWFPVRVWNSLCCAVWDWLVDLLASLLSAVLSNPQVKKAGAAIMVQGMNDFVTQPDLNETMQIFSDTMAKGQEDFARSAGQDFPKLAGKFLEGMFSKDKKDSAKNNTCSNNNKEESQQQQQQKKQRSSSDDFKLFGFTKPDKHHGKDEMERKGSFKEHSSEDSESCASGKEITIPNNNNNNGSAVLKNKESDPPPLKFLESIFRKDEKPLSSTNHQYNNNNNKVVSEEPEGTLTSKPLQQQHSFHQDKENDAPPLKFLEGMFRKLDKHKVDQQQQQQPQQQQQLLHTNGKTAMMLESDSLPEPDSQKQQDNSKDDLVPNKVAGSEPPDRSNTGSPPFWKSPFRGKNSAEEGNARKIEPSVEEINSTTSVTNPTMLVPTTLSVVAMTAIVVASHC